MFLWRFRKTGLFGGIAYSLAKAAQILAGGNAAGATAVLRGTFQMQAPKAVLQKLGQTS